MNYHKADPHHWDKGEQIRLVKKGFTPMITSAIDNNHDAMGAVHQAYHLVQGILSQSDPRLDFLTGDAVKMSMYLAPIVKGNIAYADHGRKNEFLNRLNQEFSN